MRTIGLLVITFLAATLLAGCLENIKTVAMRKSPSGEIELVVAASDSNFMEKHHADYVCSGKNDQIKIQAAIEAGSGGKVILLEGTYNKDNAQGISIPSDTEVELVGAKINLNKLDTDACIFTNSDPIRGNKNISIHGTGVLNGNRHLSTSGEQYAVNFEHVSNSLVECYIDNFRTLEGRFYESDCVIKNLRFENMEKIEETLMQFIEPETEDWVWIGNPLSWEIDKINPVVGQSCLKIVLNKNDTVQIYNNRWKKKRIVSDLRYKCFSFWVKIEGEYSPSQLQEIIGLVRLEFDGADGTKTVTYNTFLNSFNSNEWVRVFIYPWNVRDLSACMDRASKFKLVIDTNKTGSLSGPFTIYLDDICLVPVKSGGKICFSADDGHSTWARVEEILNEYGYRGCYNVSPAKAYANGEHYSDIVNILHNISDYGGEIASHGFTHDVHRENLWDELIRSRETLIKDGMGDVKFMALPGGKSEWTGDMVANCHQVYVGVRSTLPCICSKGETVPVFSTVPIILSENLDSIKMKIAWAVNNHENVALYFHRLDNIDMSETRLRDVCNWLYDKGIPVVTYSEMFAPR